jgi:hypothetical protein
MAYVYTHTRLDNNTIFYVGIGSDTKGKYTRAYNKKGRSLGWKDIGKHIPYKTDIVLDNISWEAACQEEIRLIAEYGRKDLGKGLLTNLTDGGDGAFGRIYIVTEETKQKLRKPRHSEQQKEIWRQRTIQRGRQRTQFTKMVSSGLERCRA